MAAVGDRVQVDSKQVGTPPRCGVVMGVRGSLLQIRWEDGSESSFVPAAGSLSVVTVGKARKR